MLPQPAFRHTHSCGVFPSPILTGNADFSLPYRTLPTDKPSEKSCRKSHHESNFPYQTADLQFCYDCGFDYCFDCGFDYYFDYYFDCGFDCGSVSRFPAGLRLLSARRSRALLFLSHSPFRHPFPHESLLYGKSHHCSNNIHTDLPALLKSLRSSVRQLFPDSAAKAFLHKAPEQFHIQSLVPPSPSL